MPGYFTVNFAYRKSETSAAAAESFVRALIDRGLSYKSGVWHSEKDSLEDIIVWNRRKLESNFSLGATEHYSNDYKQMLFNWEGFSEARLFINNEAEDEFFSFSLIVPEINLIDFRNGEWAAEPEKMKRLEELALGVWSRESLSCIQTSWEYSYGARAPEEIEQGAEPSSEPFSIIPGNLYRECWGAAVDKAERNGLLLRAKDDRNSQ